MPDPSKFKDKQKFMSECMTQVKSEGKSQSQAVGQCLGMWRSEHGGKKPPKKRKKGAHEVLRAISDRMMQYA